MIQENQQPTIVVEEIKEPELVIDTTVAPLPPNLSPSPMTPKTSPQFEKNIQEPIIKFLNNFVSISDGADNLLITEDEILSDLDNLIENYDEELKKQEEEELARMKKELLEKIEQEQNAEQEKQLNKIIETLVNKTIKESKQEVQKKLKPKSIKPIKKAVRKPRKVIQKPVAIDLLTISLEDLMAEAKKRGYVMNKYVAPKTIDTYQHRILANTVDDLDLLSDDEETDE